MKEISYWLDTPYTPRPALNGETKADVIVVGAGITGVSTAYHCAKLGFKTVLIEKETVAFGSGGRNAGMVVDGFPIDFIQMKKTIGTERAKEAWLNTMNARKIVSDLISENFISCDFSQPGSLYLGRDAESIEWLKHEAQARQRAGIPCELFTDESQLPGHVFQLGLYNESDCLLNPVKFLRGLCEVAEKLGVTIYENTPLISFDAHMVETPNGKIFADKVVLALESENKFFEQETDVQLYREVGIVTEELPEEKINALDWDLGGMFWIFDQDHTAVRRIGNRLFVCGNVALDPSAEDMNQVQKQLITMLASYFPNLEKTDLKVSHIWSGVLVLTNTSRPRITKYKGSYAAFGHAGNGLTNGVMVGKMLAESFSGKEISELYRF